MKTHHTAIATIVSAAASMVIGLASPALAGIVNGSFEAPVVVPSYSTYGPVTGFSWIVYSGSIDHGRHPGGTDCFLGNTTQCVDLNGDSAGAIKQSFATVAGHKYRVTFYMSRHRQLILSNRPATLNARIDGAVVQSFTHSVIGGSTASSGGWQQKYFDFFAGSGTTELAFESTTNDANVGVAAGPQIDNVSVTELASYDIAVKKSHQGNKYIVAVTNPGSAIPVGAKIEVIDVVPPGLTLTVAASNLPWTCTPAGTIVGPDSITCTYSVTTAIPTSGSLPVLQFVASPSPMSPDCPNCVRARLYLSNVIGFAELEAHLQKGRIVTPIWSPKSLVLVSESNLANNVSCIK
jgi:hypothetical protein